jgi:choline dehydrogenase
MLEGVTLARAIARNPVFAPFTAGELISGDAVTDDALAEVITANLAIYGHPTATAPMGGPPSWPWSLPPAGCWGASPPVPRLRRRPRVAAAAVPAAQYRATR